MKVLQTVSLMILLVASSTIYAGVEMDLVSRDAGGKTTQTMKVYAQAGKVRIEDSGESADREMSMIFLEDEFVIIDHAEKSYVVMDEAMMAEMGTQINSAMQQMQEQLKNLPPEQRAMVEEMMKGKMKSMMGGSEEKQPVRVEKTGMGEWESEPCTQFAVRQNDELLQEVCAAELSDVKGATEAKQAFESMARFMTRLAESMPEIVAGSLAETPMALMDQIDGFPVRTTHYEEGEFSQETTLEGIAEMDLDASIFTAPEGYTKQDPFAGR